jgi:hypothetical protein
VAVQIQKGGWVLLFLLGLALVAYSLDQYGVLDLGRWLGWDPPAIGRRP